MNEVVVQDAEYHPITSHEEILEAISKSDIPIEKLVAAVVHRVRQKLIPHTHIYDLELNMTAQGRVHSGDIKLTFNVGGYSERVTSHSLKVAVEEYIRRKSFDSTNDGLMLSYSGGIE